MRNPRDLLLSALRHPESLASLDAGELDLTLRYARRARLLGRLAVDTDAAGVFGRLPVEARDQLAGARVVAESRLKAALWELDRVSHALDLHGCRCVLVVLKGCAYSLAGAPNARGRLVSDLDVLVPESRLADVERALRQQGWVSKTLSAYDEQYYRRWSHELPPLTHPEREIEVDLHHNLLMRTARHRPDAGRLLDAALAVKGSDVRLLAPVDMVLHAAAHLFEGGEMIDALRELIDIADLLEHFGRQSEGFCSEFWPRAAELDLVVPAFYALRYAQRFLGCSMPPQMVDAARRFAPARVAVALMDQLVPDALFPLHPDAPGRVPEAARALLYARSHWVKMPPLMLARHLAHKASLRVRAGFSSVT